MSDWQRHDTGASGLVLAGPVMQRALTADVLRAHGIDSFPQIAVDGGISFAVNPVLWAGDGDSGAAPKNVPVIPKQGQDETDLSFCLKGVHGWKWGELHLFGFLGGRRDHELANFGEVNAAMKGRKGFARAVFYGANFSPEAYCFREGAHSLSLNGAFSVFTLSGAEIGISGACRYPADHAYLEPLSGRGVSNHGDGLVSFRCGKPFMVLVPAS